MMPAACDLNSKPANTMWRKPLYSGFHTPKAVAYHEPTSNVVGHDRSQPWAHGGVFWPQHRAGIRYQNTSQIQILLASHFEKTGGVV